MHINPHWIKSTKRFAASRINIGFWICSEVFYLLLLALLYRHRMTYAEGLLPDLFHFSDDGLLFSAARDTEHAMTVFFLMVLYFSVSVAVIPFVILYCWRLRRELAAISPASSR